MAEFGSVDIWVNNAGRALATELRDTGIVVGRVRPGMVITDAVIREAQADIDGFQKSRATMNTLVEQMLAFGKNGGKIAWRMLKSRFVKRPDQFTQFGL